MECNRAILVYLFSLSWRSKAVATRSFMYMFAFPLSSSEMFTIIDRTIWKQCVVFQMTGGHSICQWWYHDILYLVSTVSYFSVRLYANPISVPHSSRFAAPKKVSCRSMNTNYMLSFYSCLKMIPLYNWTLVLCL